jgi:hypothetical protein
MAGFSQNDMNTVAKSDKVRASLISGLKFGAA